MSVPILLVTGFLGAGKTTFINTLLQAGHGQRIAAIVNDFGSINIDAEFLESATDEVIGLRNGCICCSLQGDLLRTMRQVLSGPTPDLIVIEASGVADPEGIMSSLLDPVLWSSAALDTVVCIVDAQDVTDNPDRMRDPLWKAQVLGADVIQISKATSISAEDMSRLELQLRGMGKRVIFSSDDALISLSRLLGHAQSPRTSPGAGPDQHADRFVSTEWECEGAVHMADFQQTIGILSPSLLRAKGFVSFIEKPAQTFVFQLTGQRAAISPSDRDVAGCRLILIGERGVFDPRLANDRLNLLSG